MDSRQVQFVKALTEFSQVETITPDKPVIVKRTNSVLGKTNFFVCSKTEPHALKLPMNVMWVDYNRLSLRYKQILKRVSKQPDVQFGTQHTYVSVTSFDDMWFDHFYDLGDEPNGFYDPATETSIGIYTLSRNPTDAADVETPTVVTSTDPRNSNPRNPLPHDGMHPEIPARMLRTTGRIVNLDNGDAEANYSLIATNIGDSEYRKLHVSEVHEDSPVQPAQAASALLVAPMTAELYLPEYTIEDRARGVPVLSARTFTINVRAFGNSDPDTDHRKYLGIFVPSSVTVRHNNVIQTVSGNQFVANQVGKYTIQAELVDVNGANSVQVEGAITVVEALL